MKIGICIVSASDFMDLGISLKNTVFIAIPATLRFINLISASSINAGLSFAKNNEDKTKSPSLNTL
ncbi:MAG: hypothetical protein PUE23_11385 [Inconstantimicrobium porci]|nr:hypothetical protein [Inconstantimicrobium porci]MDD6771426.1 hypothetical protein [Inconstantimicrobium porci]